MEDFDLDYMDDEFYCFCEDIGCTECDEGDHCESCFDMNTHDCALEGCYGDNPNAHIDVFGTYAPGSDFDDYYS